MSRRAVKVTQDDITRALRAAAKLGVRWRVRITPDGAIELWQDGESQPALAQEEPIAPVRESVL